jgi:hypothetical protein
MGKEEKMKKLGLTFCVFVLFVILTNTFSNPIATYFINEFMIDSTGWKIELHPSDSQQDSILLNDWFLTSKTDTAYFKEGIYISGDRFIVITQDSLISHLNIDAAGDTLTLYQSEGFYMDRLFFGNTGGYSTPSPKPGQSICLRVYSDGYWQQHYYYLDNTPTMGYPNDSSNAKGYIDGYVKDSLNNPIEGVKVIYGYVDVPPNGAQPVYVETNSSGYFSYYDFSIFKRLEFGKDGFYCPDTSLQIWPDSIVTLDIQMSLIVGIAEVQEPTIDNFELKQNYPNPFNSSTTFIYSLSENGFIEVNIYDEKGELVEKLFKGNQPKGEYKLNWNADNLASGIYFYEVKTKGYKISKKCLLLK